MLRTRRSRRGLGLGKVLRPFADETLEPRRLLASIIWDGGGDGVNWTDRFNWSGNVVPGPADDVTIDRPVGAPIVVNQADFWSATGGVRSLVSNASLLIRGLRTQGAATLSGTVTVQPQQYMPLRVGSTLTVDGTLLVQERASAGLEIRVGTTGSVVLGSGLPGSSKLVAPLITNHGLIQTSPPPNAVNSALYTFEFVGSESTSVGTTLINLGEIRVGRQTQLNLSGSGGRMVQASSGRLTVEAWRDNSTSTGSRISSLRASSVDLGGSVFVNAAAATDLPASGQRLGFPISATSIFFSPVTRRTPIAVTGQPAELRLDNGQPPVLGQSYSFGMALFLGPPTPIILGLRGQPGSTVSDSGIPDFEVGFSIAHPSNTSPTIKVIDQATETIVAQGSAGSGSGPWPAVGTQGSSNGEHQVVAIASVGGVSSFDSQPFTFLVSDQSEPAMSVLATAWQNGVGMSLSFVFSELVDPVSLDLTRLHVSDALTGERVFPANTSTVYNRLSVRFENDSRAWLPDGIYTIRLDAGLVRDYVGNGSREYRFDGYRVLTGDVNRDGIIGFGDLLVLSQNFGSMFMAPWQGNVDYSLDGLVGFSDLLILAQRYGNSLIRADPKPSVFGGRSIGRRGLFEAEEAVLV